MLHSSARVVGLRWAVRWCSAACTRAGAERRGDRDRDSVRLGPRACRSSIAPGPVPPGPGAALASPGPGLQRAVAQWCSWSPSSRLRAPLRSTQPLPSSMAGLSTRLRVRCRPRCAAGSAREGTQSGHPCASSIGSASRVAAHRQQRQAMRAVVQAGAAAGLAVAAAVQQRRVGGVAHVEQRHLHAQLHARRRIWRPCPRRTAGRRRAGTASRRSPAPPARRRCAGRPGRTGPARTAGRPGGR
jgi:hypothetical protein